MGPRVFQSNRGQRIEDRFGGKIHRRDHVFEPALRRSVFDVVDDQRAGVQDLDEQRQVLGHRE